MDKRHTNHRNTERLVSIFGNVATTRKIALVGEAFRLKQVTCGRGGRPLTSYAMEYCLTLPKGYRPSTNQWRLIVKDCCIALAKLCDLNAEELKAFQKQIRAVLHQQKQSGNRGSGDHVHLIIGKVAGSRVLKELQKKKATKVIKQAFSLATLKHANMDHKLYKVVENERGRRLNTWQYQRQKSLETLEIEKMIKKIQSQSDKWTKAKQEGDFKQEQRQFNRLQRNLIQIEKYDLSSQHRTKLAVVKSTVKSRNFCTRQ
ncbi:hypothetical protein EDB71_106119 [Vibrio crassostreae]|nr:hypothetical protein EDB71_106119 [Vibrio crassostreae]